MVWYLARSTGSFRAASARAAASEIGVPLRLAALSVRLSPDLLGSFAAPLAGEGENRSALPPDAAADGLAPATAPPLLFPAAASTSAGSVCAYSATRRVRAENSIAFRNA